MKLQVVTRKSRSWSNILSYPSQTGLTSSKGSPDLSWKSKLNNLSSQDNLFWIALVTAQVNRATWKQTRVFKSVPASELLLTMDMRRFQRLHGYPLPRPVSTSNHRVRSAILGFLVGINSRGAVRLFPRPHQFTGSFVSIYPQAPRNTALKMPRTNLRTCYYFFYNL